MTKKASLLNTSFEQTQVSISSVHPNRYNYNVQKGATFAKLVASLREFGFVQPVVVREDGDGYEIVNGEHRYRAAIELKLQSIPIINLGAVTDVRAKQLAVILNELGGSPDEVRLADLLRDISAEVTIDDLQRVMPFSDKELEMYLSTIDFSFVNLPAEDSGTRDLDADDAPESGDGLKAETVKLAIGKLKGSVTKAVLDEFVAEYNSVAQSIGSTEMETVLTVLTERLRSPH